MPAIQINRRQARRFLLIHHFLWPPRRLRGKSGIRQVFQRLGSIQYDPIGVTGRNHDLALQSRVGRYRSELVHEMLYGSRVLIDGWGKMASIFLVEDWPEFTRQRDAMRSYYRERWPQAMELEEEILGELGRSGPLASNGFGIHSTADGAWGQSKREVGICLEGLYRSGRVGIAGRAGTRRSYDLIEVLHDNLAPEAGRHHRTDERYQRWHILRRIGSLGLARNRAGVHWSGIAGVDSPERQALLDDLVARGELLPVQVEGSEAEPFFMRASDLPNLERARRTRLRRPRAAFLAPLDNLLWDRDAVRVIFGFDYVWEVYKPERERQFGYYVLPILVGDRLVGRIEPRLESGGQALEIRGWWWEANYTPQAPDLAALGRALQSFCRFLDVQELYPAAQLPPPITPDWLAGLANRL